MKPYKGYRAKVEYDPEDAILVGRVDGIRDIVTFFAEDVASLEQEFHASVDEYIVFCQERGGVPERPASGKVLVRMGPELHQKVLKAARQERKSLNAWMIDAVMLRLEPPAHAGGLGAVLAASLLGNMRIVHSDLGSVRVAASQPQPTISPRVRFAGTGNPADAARWSNPN
jgi:predicted HicB family RNase H-like nuclease